MQFKQGDKAVCTLDDMEVEILYGPVPNAVGNESYLVQWRNGERSSLVWVDDLEPAPRFKVGQTVTFNYSAKGEHFELLAGPFYDYRKKPFWVVKDQAGDQAPTEETHMVVVM